jgi:hypothetical protein
MSVRDILFYRNARVYLISLRAQRLLGETLHYHNESIYWFLAGKSSFSSLKKFDTAGPYIVCLYIVPSA